MEQFVAPNPDSAKAVTDWLSKNGLQPTIASPAGDMLTINVSVDQANTLLNANYSVYTHVNSDTDMLRTMSYSLPADLAQHVDFVYPTTQ